MTALGFDTSNYTTSLAWFDGERGENASQLLPVAAGALGLRQSDAVFHHTRSLPELAGRLFSQVPPGSVQAVGVSTRPRAVEGSYMPCFLVGYSHGAVLAKALGVPLIQVSHQQGHLAAAAWAAGRMELLDGPFLAWHLSGGTTELLCCQPEGWNVACRRIGGTMDISAGQLIDRTGQLLSLPFPAGKALDELSRGDEGKDAFPIKNRGLEFSFSGLENKVRDYSRDHAPAQIAGYALRSVVGAVARATEAALKEQPGLPVLFSGGVASNSLLRETLAPLGAVFAPPRFSTDNALGVAVLAHRALEG